MSFLVIKQGGGWMGKNRAHYEFFSKTLKKIKTYTVKIYGNIKYHYDKQDVNVGYL